MIEEEKYTPIYNAIICILRYSGVRSRLYVRGTHCLHPQGRRLFSHDYESIAFLPKSHPRRPPIFKAGVVPPTKYKLSNHTTPQTQKTAIVFRSLPEY
jgi:hypothetical protein